MSFAALLLAATLEAHVADGIPDLLRRPDWQIEPDLHVAPPPPLDAPTRAEALRRSAKPEQDPRAWTNGDTALQAAFGLAMLGDYLQTRRITRAGRELNSVMGARGQRVPPEVYFPATMALQTLAMRALPQPWRRRAQLLSLGFEGGVVGRNALLGVGFGF